ncbi:MAG TPA: heavy-metal-associated domain-containing protein [Fimbriimonadaceae bacterium]|nr:heavy-metal-associated domain-containing protein [Fimbriimonadaceae bacterium]
MKTTFYSEDISCGGCIASIEKALAPVAGVVSVQGNPDEKTVTVEHDESLSTEAILAKLDETGFESRVAG